MMRSGKLFPWLTINLVAFVVVWIMGSSFGEPDPGPPPLIKTIYAGIEGMVAYTSSNNGALIAAQSHGFQYDSDLENLVSIPYSGNHHIYLEYGVSKVNCTDYDHLTAITEANGFSSVGFERNVGNSGTVWLQLVSQCEEDFDGDPNGNGVYFKGVQWYSAYNFPESPEQNIWIDQGYVTNCQYPWNAELGATEYGCGNNDAE